MKKITILSVLLLLTVSVAAQKETSNWAFGNGCGLTWNTTRSAACVGLLGTPHATLDDLPTTFGSAINTMEGCFSYSDKNGNLLFYSDGVTIWNRNHKVMTNGNGLTGNSSSAQSGIIVPYPEHPSQYVAITIANMNFDRLSYSIVNMNTSDGLGEVLAKNVKIENNSGVLGESVTSVRHANGVDFWIVAPGKSYTSSFYLNAWLLTKDGVADTPVVTSHPGFLEPLYSNGYIKFSPDNKHFIWAGFMYDCCYYGDFDPATGQFSNIKRLADYEGTAFTSPYGVEFSPLQTVVYIADKNALYAYKADEFFAASDISSVTKKIFNTPSYSGTALQLGPDGRIYWAMQNATTIRIIDDINDFDNIKLYLSRPGFLNATSQGGLPSFLGSWATLSANDVRGCKSNATNFNIEISFLGSPGDYPVKLTWDFGDGSTPADQAISAGTTTYVQSHIYSTPGEYTVTVTPYKSNGSPLSSTKFKANIKDCLVRVNRNVRSNLKGQ